MFLTLMWLAVAAGMVTVISAAMNVQETLVCKGYDVTITGAEKDKLFTSEEQVIKLLKMAANGDVKGQRLNDFNLPRIEDLLEQSAWVYNAELYFDQKDRLRVNVVERKPLARVFTNLGESFYLDEAGKYIPLSEKISLDVPVFTGYPTKKVLNANDSVLLRNVIATASFINNDPFWSSQVSQVDINNCGEDCWEMEMIPIVGNHRVQLGDGSDVASKFHRLYLFYDQVLRKKGFDKYQKIDVQYEGQVLGVKNAQTKVDSLQLRKNIETLLSQSRKANELMEETPNIGANAYILDTATSNGEFYSSLGTDQQLAEGPVEAVTNIAAPAKEERKPEPVKREVKVEPKKKSEVKETAKKAETKKMTTKKDVKPASKKTEPRKEVKKPENKKTVAKANAKKTTTSAKKQTASSKTTTKKKN